MEYLGVVLVEWQVGSKNVSGMVCEREKDGKAVE